MCLFFILSAEVNVCGIRYIFIAGLMSTSSFGLLTSKRPQNTTTAVLSLNGTTLSDVQNVTTTTTEYFTTTPYLITTTTDLYTTTSDFYTDSMDSYTTTTDLFTTTTDYYTTTIDLGSAATEPSISSEILIKHQKLIMIMDINLVYTF